MNVNLQVLQTPFILADFQGKLFRMFHSLSLANQAHMWHKGFVRTSTKSESGTRMTQFGADADSGMPYKTSESRITASLSDS